METCNYGNQKPWKLDYHMEYVAYLYARTTMRRVSYHHSCAIMSLTIWQGIMKALLPIHQPLWKSFSKEGWVSCLCSPYQTVVLPVRHLLGANGYWQPRTNTLTWTELCLQHHHQVLRRHTWQAVWISPAWWDCRVWRQCTRNHGNHTTDNSIRLAKHF